MAKSSGTLALRLRHYRCPDKWIYPGAELSLHDTFGHCMVYYPSIWSDLMLHVFVESNSAQVLSEDLYSMAECWSAILVHKYTTFRSLFLHGN